MFMDQEGVWERNNRVVAGFSGIRDLLDGELTMHGFFGIFFFLEGSIAAVGRHGNQRGLGSEGCRSLWSLDCSLLKSVRSSGVASICAGFEREEKHALFTA